MGPDVDGLVGHLEAAEDAVQRRALWMAVTGDDAVLPEHLNTKQTFREVHFVSTSVLFNFFKVYSPLRLFIIHQEMKSQKHTTFNSIQKSLLYKSLKLSFFVIFQSLWCSTGDNISFVDLALRKREKKNLL